MTLVSAVALAAAGSAQAALGYFEGFEPTYTPGIPNWTSIVSAEASGTGGITARTGGYYGAVAASGTAYTQFGGYSSSFGVGYVASVSVYLDTAWADGTGFEYSVASNNQSGVHLRDFVFHIAMVSGNLQVQADNSAYGLSGNAYIVNQGAFGTVTSSGWYTMQHTFDNVGGALAVTMALLDSANQTVFTRTRSDPTDLIATVVGGNRYGWLGARNVGLAIDDTSLTAIPAPGAIALLGLAGLVARRRRN